MKTSVIKSTGGSAERGPRSLTSTLVDGPRLLVEVVGVGLVQVEALRGVGHGRTVLRLVWERRSGWQNWARQVCLRAAMWVPLVRQLRGEEQQMVHLWDINSLKSYSLNTLEAFFCVCVCFI